MHKPSLVMAYPNLRLNLLQHHKIQKQKPKNSRAKEANEKKLIVLCDLKGFHQKSMQNLKGMDIT